MFKSNSLGVNLIGFFNTPVGLGESGRIILKTLQTQNIPINQICAEGALEYLKEYSVKIPNKKDLNYPINLFGIGQLHILDFVSNLQFRLSKLEKQYNIAMWYWETDVIPPSHLACLEYLDEIWVTSHYLQEILKKYTNKTIYRFPQPLNITLKESDAVIQNGEKLDKFLFLFCFDFMSVETRKNPGAIIEAFQRVFPEQNDVQLVIKSQHGKELLQKMPYYKTVQFDSRITWIDESMDRHKHQALINSCDCYISLHRSEGFGLTMAEAMLAGKPVIATGYSGNLDFMNNENSYLCDYKLVSIGKGIADFPENGSWAEPDVKHAATLMRHVYENKDEALEKGRKGKEYLYQNHSLDHVGKLMQQRLNTLSFPSTKKTSRHFAIQHYKKIVKKNLYQFLKKIFHLLPQQAQNRLKKCRNDH